jgi:hypothetical protein
MSTTTITTSTVSTGVFTWDPKTRSYTIEMSDLNAIGVGFRLASYGPEPRPRFLTLVGERTGREVPVRVRFTKWDADGDVQWWQLEPVLPGHKSLDFAVRVYND